MQKSKRTYSIVECMLMADKKRSCRFALCHVMLHYSYMMFGWKLYAQPSLYPRLLICIIIDILISFIIYYHIINVSLLDAIPDSHFSQNVCR